MNAYEYRVVVMTTDERVEAPELIEREIARALTHPFGERVYVERMKVTR